MRAAGEGWWASFVRRAQRARRAFGDDSETERARAAEGGAAAPAMPSLDALEALAPLEHAREMAAVRRDAALVFRMVRAIRADDIGCVVPSAETVHRLRRTTDVLAVLPEARAFSSTSAGGGAAARAGVTDDAVVRMDGPTTTVRARNPLLQIGKRKRARIAERLSHVELAMRTSGDRFASRFEARKLSFLDALDAVLGTIPAECAQQRSRLRHSHPHLAYYEFVDESVHSRESMPRYVYGGGGPHAPHTPLVSSE